MGTRMSADNTESRIPEDTMGEPKLPECDDVEITPEMIEAGLELLFFYERGEDDGGECIREIYVAMERVRSQSARAWPAHHGLLE